MTYNKIPNEIHDIFINTNAGVFILKGKKRFRKHLMIAPPFFFCLLFFVSAHFILNEKPETEIHPMDVFYALLFACLGMLVCSYACISPSIISGVIDRDKYNNLYKNSDIETLSWRYIEPVVFIVLSISYIICINI